MKYEWTSKIDLIWYCIVSTVSVENTDGFKNICPLRILCNNRMLRVCYSENSSVLKGNLGCSKEKDVEVDCISELCRNIPKWHFSSQLNDC